MAARAKALEGVGWMAIDQRDLDRAEAAAQEGLKLGAEVEIESSLAASFRTMLGYAADTTRRLRAGEGATRRKP